MRLFFYLFIIGFGIMVFYLVYSEMTLFERKLIESNTRRRMKRERREIRFIIRSSRIKKEGPGWWDSRGWWIKYVTFIIFLHTFIVFADLA